MPFRMLEYYLLLKQRYPDNPVKQMVLEEMAKQDSFYDLGFKKAKKEDIAKLYQKLKLNPEQIADILDLPLEFVEKVIEEVNLEKKKENR